MSSTNILKPNAKSYDKMKFWAHFDIKNKTTAGKIKELENFIKELRDRRDNLLHMDDQHLPLEKDVLLAQTKKDISKSLSKLLQLKHTLTGTCETAKKDFARKLTSIYMQDIWEGDSPNKKSVRQNVLKSITEWVDEVGGGLRVPEDNIFINKLFSPRP